MSDMTNEIVRRSTTLRRHADEIEKADELSGESSGG